MVVYTTTKHNTALLAEKALPPIRPCVRPSPTTPAKEGKEGRGSKRRRASRSRRRTRHRNPRHIHRCTDEKGDTVSEVHEQGGQTGGLQRELPAASERAAGSGSCSGQDAARQEAWPERSRTGRTATGGGGTVLVLASRAASPRTQILRRRRTSRSRRPSYYRPSSPRPSHLLAPSISAA